jgi:Complex I intermediate-associated protein 30 (CIA30)
MKHKPLIFLFFLTCCVTTIVAQSPFVLFDEPSAAMDSSKAWVVLTDRIVEGSSKAEVKMTDSTALFFGLISNHNKAGLAQLISPRFEENLADYTGIRLRLRGDSSMFVLALHTDLLSSEAKHLEYRICAPTAWQTIQIPFSTFYSAYFDVELIEKAPKIELIHYLSIINAYQEGRFTIEIDSIDFY